MHFDLTELPLLKTTFDTDPSLQEGQLTAVLTSSYLLTLVLVLKWYNLPDGPSTCTGVFTKGARPDRYRNNPILTSGMKTILECSISQREI